MMVKIVLNYLISCVIIYIEGIYFPLTNLLGGYHESLML